MFFFQAGQELGELPQFMDENACASVFVIDGAWLGICVKMDEKCMKACKSIGNSWIICF